MSSNSSLKTIGTVVGIIVSCIAIFTFVTGYETLREIFGSNRNSNNDNQTYQEPISYPTDVTQPENVAPVLSAGYLFSDDFESGIKSDWFAIDGDWRMINGNLQGVSGQPARIGVGSSSWQNYTIEATVGGLRNTVSSARQFLETNPNIVFFGVRQSQDASTGYWFGVSYWKQECSFDRNFEEAISFHSAENYLNENQSHAVKLEISGDLFKFSLNGETICSFSDPSIGNGVVVISMFPGTGAEPSYPWIDYINIAER